MTELSGLPLRQAVCEGLGWRITERQRPGYCTVIALWEPDEVASVGEFPKRTSLYSKTKERGKAIDELLFKAPALESDPAAFWPAFEKWLFKRELSYECYGPIQHPQKPRLAGKFGFKIAVWDGNFYDPRWERSGDTQLEAGCRAWLSALQSLKEAR